jgi:hypothetical protein
MSFLNKWRLRHQTHSWQWRQLQRKAKVCNLPIRWPRGLRRGCAAVRLLGLRVRIPPVAWIYVSCECCVSLGRGLCDRLITRPEESYRVWCECDREATIMRRPWPTGSCCAVGKKKCINLNFTVSRHHVCLWYRKLRPQPYTKAV